MSDGDSGRSEHPAGPAIRYAPSRSDVDAHGWVKLEMSGDYPKRRLPFVCVNCLSPTERRERLKVGRYSGSVSYGLCENCARATRRDQRRIVLPFGLLIVACAVTLFVVSLHFMKDRSTAVLPACLFIAIAVMPLAHVATKRALPFEVRREPFGPVWLRFRNERFLSIYLNDSPGNSKVDIQK